MLLMLDNYDSFTYNLVQYLGELGEEVKVYRNDEITVAEVENLKPAHVVISPGPCTPNEAGISVPLIKSLAGKVPILGVCPVAIPPRAIILSSSRRRACRRSSR